MNEASCVVNQRLAQDADQEADSEADLVLNRFYLHTKEQDWSIYSTYMHMENTGVALGMEWDL